MRSDFLNLFQLFPGAQENYKEITLDPMPSERFAEVIEGPARRFGRDLDEGLSERLAADTSFNDALPLLAYTLEKLYERCRESGKLTIKAYESLFPAVTVIEGGKLIEYRGVAASIKHRADDILRQAGYVGLTAEDPRMRDLRRALFALARVGEAGQFTRRIALKSRMPESCTDVLKRFVDDRLLVTGQTEDRKPEDRKPTLSVAHEALFRVWDQLGNWLHQDRRALALRGQIEAEATERKWPWPEDRVIDAVTEIERSGVSLDDAKEPEAVRAFLGPTGREELEQLPALGAQKDAEQGSGRYGKSWQLPLSHEARAKVGVPLALLGDRARGDGRKGTGLDANGLPDIDWCSVDGGKVTLQIREDMNDPNSKIVDEPTREVEDFHIARYPVAVAQFQAFVRACHDGKRWTRTFLRDAGDYPPPKHRVAYANHPADTVNWYDAMAFCEWLSESRGFEIRLPTEFAWQRAATGGDRDRGYPWGPEEWDPAREPWRANTYESELGRRTAVGMYPEGASPVGALDMAGTSYEWCLNAFDDPDNLDWPANPQERRAVRGGSWNNSQANARCAARNGNNANNRNDNNGFRVCCSSHIFPVLFMARHFRVPLRAHRDLKDRGRFRKCSPTTVCGPRLEEERWRGRVPSARIASRGHAVGRMANRGASWATSPEAPRLLMLALVWDRVSHSPLRAHHAAMDLPARGKPGDQAPLSAVPSHCISTCNEGNPAVTMNYQAYITRDAAICGGEPVVAGTRVTVRTVLASLAEGMTPEAIVADFPTVSEAAVRAVIAFAAASAEEDLPLPAIPDLA
jgi:formylglycine-generating enzyme required for sulfatase activity/uncharacterized protein (DUF433 family)